MSTEHLLVLTTCPDSATATRIATVLLEEKLAACVNQVPGIQSLYRWEGRIEQDDEVLMLIKTTKSAYDQLEALIRERHPYELPEVIAVPLAQGSHAYLEWLTKSTC
jgi:periplasmic divalent cation tolerance protein